MSTAASAIIRGLYVLTPTPAADQAVLINQVSDAIRGGASLIQYRDKHADTKTRHATARALLALCRQQGVPLIINDDIGLAAAIGADGVHLGRDDAALSQARRQLGKEAIIGISCYNRLNTAVEAEKAGADYVAFGSFYPSTVKPDAVRASLTLLHDARKQLTIPIVAIGGISADNADALLQAGADAVAVISGIFATTDISGSARTLADLFSTQPDQETT